MIADRPDLERRTTLSKSALGTFDACAQKAWWDLHERRPMIPNEKVSFGSALDRAVEAMVRGDTTEPANLAAAAAKAIAEKDGIVVSVVELTAALRGFRAEVMPKFDWTGVQTQVELRADIAGIGTVEGHPDLLWPGCVIDVKSSGREKKLPSLELGFYTLLVEEATGEPVHEVGYLTWVRLKNPYWAIQMTPVTDELRRWTRAQAGAYAGLVALDAELNAGRDEPINAVFVGGPKFGCDDCSYNPANGGRCEIAYRGDAA